MTLDHFTRLVHRACDMHAAFYALGNETREATFARFTRNHRAPSIRDANHASGFTCRTPAEVEQMLAEVEAEFAGSPHRMFGITPLTPPGVAARLTLEGYALEVM